ncbi:hypothetical protein HPB51_001258 [Rhipicephalus microplus]|uniref:RRM domain-containing protein n=1 Tax=Rhipicephalus microplus TaxID=6941 RepID=A0A9J6E648_RHIMP|nr:hypothetical protein HPB51_001258 [Rhipicephalus microplus]
MRNLWVSGLANTTRAADLKALFGKHGKVVSAKIVTNAKSPGARSRARRRLAQVGSQDDRSGHRRRGYEDHGLPPRKAKSQPSRQSQRLRRQAAKKAAAEKKAAADTKEKKEDKGEKAEEEEAAEEAAEEKEGDEEEEGDEDEKGKERKHRDDKERRRSRSHSRERFARRRFFRPFIRGFRAVRGFRRPFLRRPFFRGPFRGRMAGGDYRESREPFRRNEDAGSFRPARAGTSAARRGLSASSVKGSACVWNVRSWNASGWNSCGLSARSSDSSGNASSASAKNCANERLGAQLILAEAVPQTPSCGVQ